jgi:release factor glutamine methyltransferase
VTLNQVVTRARGELQHAGISSATAALDAELLARHVLHWDRATWLTRHTDPATPDFERRYAEVMARRLAREPIAYIRGVQEFWGREFRVTPAVLIPRPETELIVETAGEFLRAQPDAVVVDIGTGSGCIAISLALEHRLADIYATDIASDALDIARENASRLSAGHIHFRHGRYLADTPRPVDLIVTNPPYVAANERPALAPEVRDHEPAVALFGGDDGLQEIRAILDVSRAALAPGGWLIIEVGYTHSDRVSAEAKRAAGLELVDFRADLQGLPRAAIIRRTGP